jgi:hypothetical protein
MFPSDLDHPAARNLIGSACDELSRVEADFTLKKRITNIESSSGGL